MSFNGSGTFVINTAGQPVVPNTVISATAFNALTNDLANGLSTCITKDGQTTPTANIPMGNNKITGLAPGTSGTDAANLSQVQGSTAKLLQSVTGTDTITAAMVPALTAYAAGQMFYFVAAGDNTGAVTINIDSLGAKSVTRDGSVALVAGDILSGEIALVVYDGTRFQLLNGNSFTNLNVSNNLTLSAGTINGVAYLNGSKVLTSGSALTFDGTNFSSTGTATVNSGNSSSVGLVVKGETGNGIRQRFIGQAASGQYNWQIGASITAAGEFAFMPSTAADGTTFTSSVYNITPTGVSYWSVGGSEQMRLTSTGLGIGTASPAYKLDVNGAANFGADVYHRIGGTPVFATSGGVTYYYGNTNGIAWRNAADNTTQMTLDSSGSLGLGVTPTTIVGSTGSNGKGFQTTSLTISSYAGTDQTYFATNAYTTSYVGGWTYRVTAAATRYDQSSGSHVWYNAPSGTAGNAITFTQAMTLDASGRLLVGRTTSDANGYLTQILGSSGFQAGLLMTYSGVGSGAIFENSSGALVFGNDNASGTTERGRFTAGGYFKASNAGTYAGSTAGYHEFYQTSNTDTVRLTSTSTAVSGAYGLYVDLTVDPNATDSFFVRCFGGAAQRASIRSNGGLANYQANNVDLSDARTKKDITPAASMWGKVAALEIVAYKYNDQTHDDVNLGVIAQQVESVEPVWVDADGFGDTPEDGVPLKTVYTKDITFAAIKALQEAMARIESLEAKVAALEAQ